MGIEELPDHSLLLGLVPGRMWLEELDASFAQGNVVFHALIAKREFIGREKKVGHNPVFPQKFIRACGFRGHGSPFLCARILRQRFK